MLSSRGDVDSDVEFLCVCVFGVMKSNGIKGFRLEIGCDMGL